MVGMFLGLAAFIYGMIMVLSPCFRWFFQIEFCELVDVIHRYMAHLTGVGENYASKLPIQQE